LDIQSGSIWLDYAATICWQQQILAQFYCDLMGNIMAQINPLNGTSGSDNFIVNGDPFNGVDVSAPGRQVVNQPSELNDFAIEVDRFVLDGTDLGITAEPVFINGTAEALAASGITNANIVVIQGEFANAGAAATAIAGTGATSGAGVFIYFNSTLQINRLVYSTDLGSTEADISILANIRTLAGAEALNALPSFSAANILLVDNTVTGDDNDNILPGTEGQDFIAAGAGNDTLDGGGGADFLAGGEGADVFAFSGDPFDGVDISAPERQIVGNEDLVLDFDFGQDRYRFDAADFGVFGDVNFAAVDASAPGAVIPSGANVIVLLNTDNDNDPATPFLAGTAANQIANLVTEDGAGFFVYFNSNLQLSRVVYSTNLNDPTADLKVLARQTDLTGQAAIDALAQFSSRNFEFQNRILDASGGPQIISVGLGETLYIENFGGAWRGSHPSQDALSEIDTLQFTGEELTAKHLQLAQVGDDLKISFLGDAAGTQVLLKNFELDNLDNLPRKAGATTNQGNIIFGNETELADSFDVFNADSTRRHIFNRDTVTFLNDLDNTVWGFNHSADVINAQGGDDQVYGLSGDDLLRGGEGNDILFGGAGADTLEGGAGNDVLVGGAGDDLLIGDDPSGERGSDTFVLAAGQGTDTIVDFEVGTDLIGLAGGLSFGSLTFENETIRFGNEVLATLTGVDTTTLDAASFISV